MEELPSAVAGRLGVPPSQVKAVVRLLSSDCTVPFIVRYRADQTGGMDEQQVLTVARAMKEQAALTERKAVVLRTLESKGARAGLLAAVRDCADLDTLEELYAPYKAARSTSLAEQARSRGLDPIAERVWSAKLRDADVPKGTEREGVMHILAERVAESASGRSALREHYWHTASLTLAASKGGSSNGKGGSSGKGGGSSNGSSLAGSVVRCCRLSSHRVLAINRAESLKELKVSVTLESKERAIALLGRNTLPPAAREREQRALLEAAVSDAFTRLLHPSMSRALRKRLAGDAEAEAMRVFASNLSALLLQRPVRGFCVLGIDPGFKHGCKLAVIDQCGVVVAHDVVYPHPPRGEVAAAKRTLRSLVRAHGVGVVAIGDGTASQETCELVAAAMREEPSMDDVRLSVVSEAGASVLSVTAQAKAAEPHLDTGAIGAASLARRLQDPLAELVKIDPKSVGVGMYQHDMPAKALASELDDAVQSCVCTVGVDLRAASAALLARIPGLNASRAAAIIDARPDAGFPSRASLLKVKGIGPKSYEQAAGFLRLVCPDASAGGGSSASAPALAEPLDCTAVHPESYGAARKLIDAIGRSPNDLLSSSGRRAVAEAARAAHDVASEKRADLAATCGVGERSLAQIVGALGAVERDPREDLPGPLLLGTQLRRLEDLAAGQAMDGVVRNVTSFGCFVNLGLKECGLLHISQLKRVGGEPPEPPGVGQTVRVVVLSTDVQRRRIALGLAANDHSNKGGGDHGGARGAGNAAGGTVKRPAGESAGSARGGASKKAKHARQ